MKLSFQSFGAGKSDLVILHGLLGSSQNWHSAAKEFGRHLQVTVPDLRNHGDSPHGEHSMAGMQADVLELFETLEVSEAFLIGHSMGGLVAMQLALARPEHVKALIIEDIGPRSQMSRTSAILEALLALDLTAVHERSDADHQLAGRIAEPRVRRFLLQNLLRHKDGSYGWRCNLAELHRFVTEGQAFNASWADQFEGPTLFVGGGLSDQRIDDQEELIAQHFPNYQLQMIPEADHWVHFDASELFVQMVLDFIRDQT